MSTIEIDASRLGDIGAPKPIEVPATSYRQGGRQMYHLTVTLAQLTQLVPKRPDPSKPIEGNRRVDPARARKFGEYVLERDNWVSPAIIVRAPSGEVEFEALHNFPDGTAWGILRIPLHVLTEILLLDGQHRTLGTFIALDEVNERIRTKRDGVEKAKVDDNAAVVATMEKSLQRLLDARERMNREHIAIDLAVVSTMQGKQMFVDIANNAKGVNPDFTTILDQRDVINRIAAELIEDHPLLADRVELGQSTRMSATNPNFIGAKSVADIVRAVHLGISGRVGARVQDELTRTLPAAVREVATFLDVLVAGFDDLREMMEGTIEPIDLRIEDSTHRSMVGSATMLRALAGAYHELTAPGDKATPPMTRSEVEVFFGRLAPKMRDIPIAEHDPLWMPTGAFIPGTNAPQARQGTINALVKSLVNWAREGNPNLSDAVSQLVAV
jgi:DGQHR domain-containing protein